LKTVIPPSFWPSAYEWTTGAVWPPATAEEASLFLDRCSRHGLLPLLFAASDLPPALEEARHGARGWQRILDARARKFHEATVEICRILGDEPAMLLKGSDYAHRLYPSAALRPMQDVDVLVPIDRIDAVCDRLTAAGLVREVAAGVKRDPAYHERILVLGKILVEVHHSFVQRPRHRVDYEALWRRGVSIEVGGRSALRLDDVDALTYHALCMAMDEFRVRLVRYVDLGLLLRQRHGIAMAAAERAREWQTARALYGALSLGCRLFPELRTDDVRAAMDHLLPAATRRFVDRWVLPAPSDLARYGRRSRLLQLWRKALLMDTPRRRLAFALEHAVSSWRYRGSVVGPPAASDAPPVE
jgi:hypothetical protein